MKVMEQGVEPISKHKPDVLELAGNRTEMGFGRTLLALERTLMAWIRTDLSLISFGFTMYKFLESMEKVSGKVDNAPRTLGMALIIIGIGTLVMAMFQFKTAIKKILPFSQTKRQPSLSMIAGVSILIVAIAMLLNMWGILRF